MLGGVGDVGVFLVAGELWCGWWCLCCGHSVWCSVMRGVGVAWRQFFVVGFVGGWSLL